MVERDLAKVETRVRFSSPAPFRRPPEKEVFFIWPTTAGPLHAGGDILHGQKAGGSYLYLNPSTGNKKSGLA